MHVACLGKYTCDMRGPYTPENYSMDESIGYLIGRARAVMIVNLDRVLAEYGMTHAQFGIFRKLLDGKAEITTGELAREWNYNIRAMTRMLDRMEEKGFIQRQRSTLDRRVMLVQLSDKGRALADRMSLAAIGMLNHHLRGFSAEEVEQFKDFLRRIITHA